MTYRLSSASRTCPALGVRGVVDGRTVTVGRTLGRTLPTALQHAKATAEARRRHPAVTVGWDERPQGVLVVADTVKSTSAGR